MSIQKMVAGSGISLFVLLTLVQITPPEINPWSTIARAIGRALNGDVLHKLDKLENGQMETRKRLDDHIRVDDDRNADAHRAPGKSTSVQYRVASWRKAYTGGFH